MNKAIEKLKRAINDYDTVVIGAGAGLSTAAGFTYTGERFNKYFSDFAAKYGFSDMYSGGFYPYKTPEEFWAYWSRYIYINRYMNAPKPVYEDLLKLVDGKDYFVITTNVDHCFQKAGFDKKRLFYTQGDYGLFQCSTPCHQSTYDNEETVKQMVLSQGFTVDRNGNLLPPRDGTPKMAVKAELIPHCPVYGEEMTMNLRSDNCFVEDEGWHAAAAAYQNFLRTRTGKVLYLELGVGYNTPVIIKYPFWNLTAKNSDALYATVNFDDADCPAEIKNRAICIKGDIAEVIELLK